MIATEFTQLRIKPREKFPVDDSGVVIIFYDHHLPIGTYGVYFLVANKPAFSDVVLRGTELDYGFCRGCFRKCPELFCNLDVRGSVHHIQPRIECGK